MDETLNFRHAGRVKLQSILKMVWACLIQLEQFDSGEAEVFEEDILPTKEDLPRLDASQVARLEEAFSKGRRQVKVTTPTNGN